MAVLPIVQYPDDRLHKIAQPINEINERIKTLAADMAETMYAANGIGLAATQIDVHERLVVIDVSEERNQLLTLINPNITHKEGSTTYKEGCLSIPEVYDEVCRAEKVTLEYQDIDGKHHTLQADGLLAICIQHELDHLAGKLFIEYLSPFKQNRIKTKMLKRKREAAKQDKNQ